MWVAFVGLYVGSVFGKVTLVWNVGVEARHDGFGHVCGARQSSG